MMIVHAKKTDLQTRGASPSLEASPSMKVLVLFVLVSSTLLLCGCATDPEDRSFFETGWRHPGQNDSRMKQ